MRALAAGGWRLAVLAGIGLGLGVSPHWAPPGGLPEAAALAFIALVLLSDRGRMKPLGLLLTLCACALLGLAAGGERIDAIEGGALRGETGSKVSVQANVTAYPKTSRGITRIPAQTSQGKVMVEISGPIGEIGIGEMISVEGELAEPPDWQRGQLRRQGMTMIVRADRVSATGSQRGGIPGLIDGLRRRSEEALSRAIPDRESALVKGFVLGQDDQIDPATEEAFEGSGLSHLLAVSGQNVVLLGLLAVPFMAAAGLRPGTRILVLLTLILIYIPLTGAGASIQRAGIMGIAGLVAIAASRPASRIYALSLAAVITLAINPRAAEDIGWQLSFAAVIGIYLLAGPLQRRLEVLIGGSPWQKALAAGAAVSMAATVATGPLIAFHFERFPVNTIAANLAAMPAVAPAMWLGMISAALGQVSPVLAVPSNLLGSVVLAYIAQIAEWASRPAWAVAEVKVPGIPALAAIYAILTASCAGILAWLTPARLGRDRAPDVARAWRWRIGGTLLAAVLLAALLGPSILGSDRRALAEPPEGGVRIEVFDVGQGDAILIRPDGSAPLLIDGGPPGGDLAGALDSAGVDRLSALVLTHGDLDHTGGIAEIIGTLPIGRFLFDGATPELLAQAKQAGIPSARIAEGDVLTAGPVRLEVIWPLPRDGLAVDADDPNSRSVVIELSLGRFRMLLTGDAESEAAPYATGDVDVLKVAHHGSDDAGLPALLESADPEVAVISAGTGNPFGHPTPETLADLEAAGATVARTDEHGTISIVAGRRGYAVETGR